MNKFLTSSRLHAHYKFVRAALMCDHEIHINLQKVEKLARIVMHLNMENR